MKALFCACALIALLAGALAAAECELSLAPVIPVVKGREIRLHYYNIARCINIDNYIINSSLAGKGFDNLAKSLRIIGEEPGDYRLILTASDAEGAVKASADCVIRVVDDSVKPDIKAIFIGDSLTHAAVYLAELQNLMGSSLTLYGTRRDTRPDSTGTERVIDHEGRSSWAYRDYVGLPEKANMPNSFFDPETKTFDFPYYIKEHPEFRDVTDVFLLSGPNDVGDQNYISNLKKITDSIRLFSKTVRIHIMLPLPNCRDGYGWGVRNHYHYINFKNAIYDYCREIIAAYGDADRTSIVSTNANIDCRYDFPVTQVSVNSRNPRTIEVVDENVHPDKYGYYRMADMIYADIIANCK